MQESVVGKYLFRYGMKVDRGLGSNFAGTRAQNLIDGN